MKYIEAPNKHKGKSGVPTLFLGGGISNCKDWQSKLVEKLKDYNVTIYSANLDLKEYFDGSSRINLVTESQIGFNSLCNFAINFFFNIFKSSI